LINVILQGDRIVIVFFATLRLCDFAGKSISSKITNESLQI